MSEERIVTPDPGTVTVIDSDRQVWVRHTDPAVDEWSCCGETHSWRQTLESYGPLVACAPLPDYRAAVQRDAQRRAAERVAGDAR